MGLLFFFAKGGFFMRLLFCYLRNVPNFAKNVKNRIYKCNSYLYQNCIIVFFRKNSSFANESFPLENQGGIC